MRDEMRHDRRLQTAAHVQIRSRKRKDDTTLTNISNRGMQCQVECRAKVAWASKETGKAGLSFERMNQFSRENLISYCDSPF